MNPTSPPTDPQLAQAEARLGELGVQVEAMQALLVRLLQDVVNAEARLEQAPVAQLVEANEQLVVAAMASQAEADTATMALDEAEQSAVTDPLTQLPNRTALVDRCRQAIANAKRHNSRLALLFLDLDEFKQFNDTQGHAFGDKVLCLTAERLLAAVRQVDTVSRHGGDEFLVLLPELSHATDAQAVAAKLVATLAAPAQIDGQTVCLSGSVGVAVYPEDGADTAALIAHADAAMYQAKRQRGGATAAPAASMPKSVPAPVPGRSPRVVDATDRHHAELREANEQLVLAALSARELRTAAELARERHLAFLKTVTEELRNPQAPIRIASAMLGRMPEPVPTLLPRVQTIVEQQLGHIARLVASLVEASAAGAGVLNLDLSELDIGAVVDAAIAEMQPLLAQRQQRLESHRPAAPVFVRADPKRLQQVLSNLLDNASTHTHHGGRISLSLVCDERSVSLMVSDNGIGITPQMLPYLFQPFVQDTRALGFNRVGLGIGLTVVRILVQAHDGTIMARSAGAGRGSQFVVTLPLLPTPPAEPQPSSAGASAATDANGAPP